MANPAIAYTTHPDATPETEISALASVYRFVLDSRAKKEATRPGSPEDAERRSDEIGAKASIP